MVLTVFSEEDTHPISNVLGALSNSTRLKIIKLLSETERPLHIKAVARILKKDYATIYRHVQVLQQNSLIIVYEVGRSRVVHLKNSDKVDTIIQIAKKISEE